MSGSSHSEGTTSTELSEFEGVIKTNTVTTCLENKSYENDTQETAVDVDENCNIIKANESKQIVITRSIIKSTMDDANGGIFTTERVTKVLKFHLMFILIAVISLVILLYPIPIILYYTDPPATSLTDVPTSPLTCNVRIVSLKAQQYIYIYQKHA